MKAEEIDDLHRSYRAALTRYTEARTTIEKLGKSLSSLGSQISAPTSRMRIWNIFCAGVGNDLKPADRSLSERGAYSTDLDPQRVSGVLSEWRIAMNTLKDAHKKLEQVGETLNAAPLPSDIKNT